MSMDTCYPCLRSEQGEGRGEGLATEPKETSFYLFIEADRKSGREFSLLVIQLRPHPNPLPKGEGVYLDILRVLLNTAFHSWYTANPYDCLGIFSSQRSRLVPEAVPCS